MNSVAGDSRVRRELARSWRCARGGQASASELQTQRSSGFPG